MFMRKKVSNYIYSSIILGLHKSTQEKNKKIKMYQRKLRQWFPGLGDTDHLRAGLGPCSQWPGRVPQLQHYWCLVNHSFGRHPMHCSLAVSRPLPTRCQQNPSSILHAPSYDNQSLRHCKQPQCWRTTATTPIPCFLDCSPCITTNIPGQRLFIPVVH